MKHIVKVMEVKAVLYDSYDQFKLILLKVGSDNELRLSWTTLQIITIHTNPFLKLSRSIKLLTREDEY